jgi:hypothetical protein
MLGFAWNAARRETVAGRRFSPGKLECPRFCFPFNIEQSHAPWCSSTSLMPLCNLEWYFLWSKDLMKSVVNVLAHFHNKVCCP